MTKFFDTFVEMLGLGLSIFLISSLLTRFMIWVGITDTPLSRSSHHAPTPKSGGISMIIGFFASMGYLYATHKIGYIINKRLFLIGIGSLITILASLKYDIDGLSFIQKFLVQIVTACFIVSAGLSVQSIPLPFIDVLNLGPLGGVLSVLWIIFFMNVFNFMDGLNGLASGVSLISAGFCIFLGILFYEKSIFYISFSLFWAILGFFIFNFPKGRIFMGDVGSQFMGLIWAIVLLIPAQESHDSFQNLSVFTVPLLFFNFIYDVCFTVGRRIWFRESFWLAHRTHLFQLCNRSGYSHTQTTMFHLCMAFIQGLGAILIQYMPSQYQILIFIPYLGGMMVYHYYVFKKIRSKISNKKGFNA